MFVLVHCAQLNNTLKWLWAESVPMYVQNVHVVCILFWNWENNPITITKISLPLLPWLFSHSKQLQHSSMLNTSAVENDCFLKHISQCVIKMYVLMFRNKK